MTDGLNVDLMRNLLQIWTLIFYS